MHTYRHARIHKHMPTYRHMPLYAHSHSQNTQCGGSFHLCNTGALSIDPIVTASLSNCLAQDEWFSLLFPQSPLLYDGNNVMSSIMTLAWTWWLYSLWLSETSPLWLYIHTMALDPEINHELLELGPPLLENLQWLASINGFTCLERQAWWLYTCNPRTLVMRTGLLFSSCGSRLL